MPENTMNNVAETINADVPETNPAQKIATNPMTMGAAAANGFVAGVTTTAGAVLVTMLVYGVGALWQKGKERRAAKKAAKTKVVNEVKEEVVVETPEKK